MIAKFKAILLSLGTLLVLSLGLILPATVSATTNPTNQSQINGCLGTGSNLDLQSASGGGCSNTDTTGGGTSLTTFIADALNILSVIVGIIAVIMIIVAGLRYASSGGSDEAVKGAKNTILYAIIGLIVVALAQVIVKFVLNKATSGVS